MIALPKRFSQQFVLLTALASLAPTAGWAQAVAEPETEAAAGTDLKTVAVAALSSRDELLKDLDFLGELGGRPGISGVITFFSGGALDVLEEGRPIGVVLQTDGAEFTPVACLPVSDIDSVLEVAENFGLEPFDAGNGVYEIEIQEQTAYLKQSGAWIFAAQSLEALGTAPADPTSELAKLVASYDLGVTVMVQNVPELYRQIALDQLRQGMEEGLTQEDDESEEDFESRRKLAEVQIDQIADLIQGLDEITLGWGIDSEGRQTFLDAIVTGAEGSDVAMAMSVYENSTSGVTAFHRPEAAASLLTTGTTPPELLEKQKEQTEAAVEMMRTQVAKGIEEADQIPSEKMREALLAATDELIDVYGDIMREGKLELGASLDLAGDGFDLIAGAYCPDPSKVESAFKKLAEGAADQPNFPGVEWGYATHAGVKMHGMSLPVPDNGKARETLGETLRVVMGVGGERVYLAVGPRGEEALKKAIDDSAKMTDQQIKPGEMIVSLGKVLGAVEKVASDNPQAGAIIGMMLDAIEDAPEGTDRLVVTTEAIKNGVKIRYLIEGGVLEAVGKMAAQAAQMQQQGGGGGF